MSSVDNEPHNINNEVNIIINNNNNLTNSNNNNSDIGNHSVSTHESDAGSAARLVFSNNNNRNIDNNLQNNECDTRTEYEDIESGLFSSGRLYSRSPTSTPCRGRAVAMMASGRKRKALNSPNSSPNSTFSINPRFIS
jgi:hypothetical protein